MTAADAFDLTKHFPRSPKQRLGGYVHLCRMFDKARAKAAGTLGEYIYPCPLDRALLEFLGISDDEFLAVATERSEQEVLQWVQEHARPRSQQELQEWTQAFFGRKPKDEDSLRYFMETRNRVAPHRTDVVTWIDLLDLEEGR
jgi:hypothetical protein